VRVFDAAEVAAIASRPEFDVPVTEVSRSRRLSYLAEAKVALEKMTADARGETVKGQAHAQVKELDAAATEKHGTAEANVVRAKGTADASAIRERLAAEASGLAEKAEAMRRLDEAGRGHEEFRLRLDTERSIALESIEARRQVAEAQARILADALKAAHIDIVGGESIFFDRLVSAISMGKSVDQFFASSKSGATLMKDYLEGGRSLPDDLKEVLSHPSLSAQDVQSLTLSALLGRLMTDGDEQHRGRVSRLLDAARQLGIDQLELTRRTDQD